MAWPSFMPIAARPSSWIDWSTIFRDVIPREWPRRLFGLGAEAYKDLVALGESLALARDMLGILEHNIWPANDETDLLFVERWENVFNLRPDGAAGERVNRLIAWLRQQGTVTAALALAITVRAWGIDDVSQLTIVVPDATSAIANNTLNTQTFSRAWQTMHIYKSTSAADPDFSLKNDILRRVKPTWQYWTAGKYRGGVMGSSATNTVRSRYNGCVYQSRP